MLEDLGREQLKHILSALLLLGLLVLGSTLVWLLIHGGVAASDQIMLFVDEDRHDVLSAKGCLAFQLGDAAAEAAVNYQDNITK